jgi:hypothetical protein
VQRLLHKTNSVDCRQLALRELLQLRERMPQQRHHLSPRTTPPAMAPDATHSNIRNHGNNTATINIPTKNAKP